MGSNPESPELETAIHAGSDSIFASYHKLMKRPEIKREKTKQDRLASLANTYAWKAMVEEIDACIKNLTELRSITPNDTVEAVGFRFLASQIAIEYLKGIRDLPEREKKLRKKDE